MNENVSTVPIPKPPILWIEHEGKAYKFVMIESVLSDLETNDLLGYRVRLTVVGYFDKDTRESVADSRVIRVAKT